MTDHAQTMDQGNAPYLAEFMAMDMDERWLHRSPRVMFETFPSVKLIAFMEEQDLPTDDASITPDHIRGFLEEMVATRASARPARGSSASVWSILRRPLSVSCPSPDRDTKC
ncbi:MAG: hypothetical protein H0U53_01990 [Actinobacteria bacterium]|nr:hypothetical protein [Actinomycetota bacterium]